MTEAAVDETAAGLLAEAKLTEADVFYAADGTLMTKRMLYQHRYAVWLWHHDDLGNNWCAA